MVLCEYLEVHFSSDLMIILLLEFKFHLNDTVYYDTDVICQHNSTHQIKESLNLHKINFHCDITISAEEMY